VAVHADEATYEIQFGHIRRPTHRNTTWDLARDEVAAHKWVDVSQRDYGLALLNDCKYGHKVKGNVLDLDLLRSVPYPGPRLVQDDEVEPDKVESDKVGPGEPHHAYTDQCDHEFTYALYPHPGDPIEGRVVQAGYALNVPLRVVPLQPQHGQRPAKASFLQVDSPCVIVEAVKRAERAAQRDQGKQQSEQLLAALREGDVRRGEVTRLCDLGAYVDLGGVEGLIHLSELSWRPVTDPGKVLQVGDQVKVYVLNVDRDRKRVGLSLKRLEPDPWPSSAEWHNVDQLAADTSADPVALGALAPVIDDGEDVARAIIVRLYECAGQSARATLRFGFPVAAAAEVNLMEEVIGPLDLHDGQVALTFRPFEIKTVRLARRI
jgi:alpha-mannosidase